MDERPSSRLLILDAQDRVLLFRFEHKRGPLAGQAFWATPGGGLEPGESYEQAACREMLEETGLSIQDPGPQIARRVVTFQLPSGQIVTSDERYFVIRTRELEVLVELWTDLEREVVADHRWWSYADVASTTDQVWPENLADILVRAGEWEGGA
ncbi:MAG: NUDIX domain-containing protein [Acetobacteraceae bacterium]|nr:NUDIX domain-containing protein [Acetobacteraceae bacterium]